MSEVTDPLAWVERAEEDYQVISLVLKRRKPFYYIACFHAQQCAEKYLKALLVRQEKDFPKVHDLLKIKTLCENAGVLVPVSNQFLQNLTMYATEIRYPGIDPSSEDAKEALATAREVRKFARKMLGLK